MFLWQSLCAQAQDNSAHSIAGRQSESQGERAGSGERGYLSGDECQLGKDVLGQANHEVSHGDVKVWPIGLDSRRVTLKG